MEGAETFQNRVLEAAGADSHEINPFCLSILCVPRAAGSVECWHSEMGPAEASGSVPIEIHCFDFLGGFMQIWLT